MVPGEQQKSNRTLKKLPEFNRQNISITEVHFQWLPSHLVITGNEIADCLAKENGNKVSNQSEELTFTEIYSKFREENKNYLYVASIFHFIVPNFVLFLETDPIMGNQQSSERLKTIKIGKIKIQGRNFITNI